MDGTRRSSKLEAPFSRVKVAIKRRKLPSLSAKNPANGGPKISAIGMIELTNEASSMVKPKDLR